MLPMHALGSPYAGTREHSERTPRRIVADRSVIVNGVHIPPVRASTGGLETMWTRKAIGASAGRSRRRHRFSSHNVQLVAVGKLLHSRTHKVKV